MRRALLNYGYEIAGRSIVILSERGSAQWQFAAVAFNKRSGVPLGELAQEFSKFDGVESFQLSHARN
jgi:putative Mg2+ transporter-C (MgtC) family protein